MNYLVPLDSETGGLNPETADILTLYIAMMDENFKIVDELDLKLKPDNGRLPVAEAQALRVNGIDLKAHMADPETITYSAAKEKILVFLKKYLKKSGRFSNLRVLGQNVPFDLKFIFKHLVPEEEWYKIMHYVLVDTKSIVDFLKDCSWMPRELGSLSSVVEYLGVPKRTAHTAKDDTLMTIDAYKAILAMMAAKKNAGSGTQQQDLISLLESE